MDDWSPKQLEGVWVAKNSLDKNWNSMPTLSCFLLICKVWISFILFGSGGSEMNKVVAIVLSAATVSPAFAQESGYKTQPAVYRDAKNAGYNKTDVHKYWDGVKAENFEAKSSCVSSNFDIPQEYMNPELMALGDSLYNGVQSLRINWWLSEWSVPSYVAIAMGLIDEKNGDRTGKRRFYGPQYPSHDASPSSTISYGLNLEGLRWSDLTGAARAVSYTHLTLPTICSV